MITRVRGDLTNTNPADRVVRWMRYDTLGRMVLNAEPHTSVNFRLPTGTEPEPDQDSMRAWRYIYNHAGDLVGTSDARGCGVDFTYDTAGRLLGEDYWPCEPHHPAHTAAPEVTYVFDARPAGAPAGSDCAAYGDRSAKPGCARAHAVRG